MENELNPAVWGLVGTLVGAAASVGTTWIANAHSARLETQRARDARAEVARTFQRQTLIDLQDFVHALARQAADNFIKCEDAYREGREWGDDFSSDRDRVSSERHERFHRGSILIQRVSNDALRRRIASFVNAVSDCMHAEDELSATTRIKRVEIEFFEVSDAIGEVLRSQYEPT